MSVEANISQQVIIQLCKSAALPLPLMPQNQRVPQGKDELPAVALGRDGRVARLNREVLMLVRTGHAVPHRSRRKGNLGRL